MIGISVRACCAIAVGLLATCGIGRAATYTYTGQIDSYRCASGLRESVDVNPGQISCLTEQTGGWKLTTSTAATLVVPWAARLIDLDSDGSPELLVADASTNQVTTFQATAGSGGAVSFSAVAVSSIPTGMKVSTFFNLPWLPGSTIFMVMADGSIWRFDAKSTGSVAVMQTATSTPPAPLPSNPCGDEPTGPTYPPGASLCTACWAKADFELADCDWAACVLYSSGKYSYYRYLQALGACGLTYSAKAVLCSAVCVTSLIEDPK